jgi:hypothetical protein
MSFRTFHRVLAMEKKSTEFAESLLEAHAPTFRLTKKILHETKLEHFVLLKPDFQAHPLAIHIRGLLAHAGLRALARDFLLESTMRKSAR